jgi:hypothetical protein
MTQLPHVLKRIRLNLARSKDFPVGSERHGYEFVAPLDADGHIDTELWRRYREHCGVSRFWEGEDDEFGRLVHKPGGAEHARWVFDYDETAEEDDEAGYRFGDHAFRNGEYVSIRGEDGEMHTFRVVSVEPAREACMPRLRLPVLPRCCMVKPAAQPRETRNAGQ